MLIWYTMLKWRAAETVDAGFIYILRLYMTHSDSFPLRGQTAVGPAGGIAADSGDTSEQKAAA